MPKLPKTLPRALVAGALLMVAIPGALSAQQRSDEEAQEATVHRIRALATTLMTWLTDQIQPASGDTTVSFTSCQPIDADDLRALLQPEEGRRYAEDVVLEDGWGHELEVHVNRQNPLTPTCVLGIRSPGRDGVFDGESYEIGPYGADEFDRDIVWMDGFFIQWPGGVGAPQV